MIFDLRLIYIKIIHFLIFDQYILIVQLIIFKSFPIKIIQRLNKKNFNLKMAFKDNQVFKEILIITMTILSILMLNLITLIYHLYLLYIIMFDQIYLI
jgi:hypothetical protein